MVARPRVNDLIGLTHSDSNRVARPEGKRRMKVPSPLPSSAEALSKKSLVTARSRDAVAIRIAKTGRLSLAVSRERARWVARRALRRRKLKLDFQAWTVVPHFDVSPMQLSDGSDKAETEAIARAASAVLDPVEPLEDVLAFLEGNARPTISDGDRGAVIVVPHRDLDVARPAVFYGIVD